MNTDDCDYLWKGFVTFVFKCKVGLKPNECGLLYKRAKARSY